SSRIFMVWFITHSIKQIQNEESVILFLVVWTVTEITRYSFYTFNLLNHLPYFIKWARYNFFIILYPVGVAGELLTIYAALPYVKKTGIFSLRLPNKYNVSFDYYYFLIIVMASYIPCKYYYTLIIPIIHLCSHSQTEITHKKLDLGILNPASVWGLD
uniref:Very-long-chain (3R)-3-hydroxyacyl-CoA dehydratase n=1 Tax=Chrysemys picta bellii TaxID=8478 RepID=A0A8C3HNY3_CHRPI